MADIYVRCKDTQITPQPVQGVLVRVFNSDGSVFITSQTTDTDGLAEFNLSLATTYRIKMSMAASGYSVESPQTITTVADSDVFDVSVELHTRPIAVDANLCRASGYFTKPDGTAAEGVVIIFEPIRDPILYGDPAVVQAMQKSRVVTDEDGYAVIDLYRGSTYGLTVAGLEYATAQVTVPDLSSVNLPDLLFAYPYSVAYSPTSASIAVGETVEITPTITLRTGVEVTLDDIDPEVLVLEFVSDDPDGVTIQENASSGFSVRGLVAGTYVITMNVAASTVFVYPEATISGSVTITVS